MEDKFIEKTADNLIAFYLDKEKYKKLHLEYENVDDIEAVLKNTNSHPLPFEFYVKELKGCLVFMFTDFCNFPNETATGSLISLKIINHKYYPEGFREFTIKLLKLLYERTEEKKVTNNG